jgi:hypothetical protein
MAEKSEAERIKKLQAKQAAIRDEIAQLKEKAAKEERKRDTRRKIIAGALALEHFEKNVGSEFGKTMLRLLNEYVPEKDRSLFDFLAPVPEKPVTLDDAAE